MSAPCELFERVGPWNCDITLPNKVIAKQLPAHLLSPDIASPLFSIAFRPFQVSQSSVNHTHTGIDTMSGLKDIPIYEYCDKFEYHDGHSDSDDDEPSTCNELYVMDLTQQPPLKGFVSLDSPRSGALAPRDVKSRLLHAIQPQRRLNLPSTRTLPISTSPRRKTRIYPSINSPAQLLPRIRLLSAPQTPRSARLPPMSPTSKPSCSRKTRQRLMRRTLG